MKLQIKFANILRNHARKKFQKVHIDSIKDAASCHLSVS